MEFLLANHPLDCPICDQGGECDLQVIIFSTRRDVLLIDLSVYVCWMCYLRLIKLNQISFEGPVHAVW